MPFTETVQSWGKIAIDSALEYDTPKVVHIKSKKVGFINRLIQIGVIVYVVVWAIILQKGYQETDEVISAVTTKLKGVAYTNITNHPNLNIEDVTPYNRIWDPVDYVIPPMMDNAFFVMTNMVITPEQSRGRCAEDPLMYGVRCEDNPDLNCVKGDPVPNGNGVKTGDCVTYIFPNGSKTKTCEIEAWCPVEYDETPLQNEAVLAAARNFTVLIKNSVSYRKFNFEKRNIAESANKSYLTTCRYSTHANPFCPVFRLEDIVAETGEDFERIAYQGGVVGIFINWDCNLDKNWDDCRPQYSFRRLDNKEAKIAKGYNFRFGHFYVINDTDYRTLTKAYGILFEVIVTGTAGKFNFIPLTTNLGAGLALLSIATVMCDIITFYILRKGTYYKSKKYLYVENVDSDEYNPYRRFPDAATSEPQTPGTK
ncbi:P2X purinoceptor 4-like isoform X2 [Anneissia japonica]|uniref:P2X purinoceptor 4-like isoform X2 n=1 Tax=Anneissia japonica TaxID=1529436 RepID=UPI0014254B12|nr:P2X purinoceptor 4-like isoform X2 [Anneissia japonica]